MPAQKPSNLIDQLGRAFSALPGLGPKSAGRIVYHLLQRNPDNAKNIAELLAAAVERIGNCQRCRNLCEGQLCAICADSSRAQHKLCVVEHASDLNAIEQTRVFDGVYFVLHGHLSPIDGITPQSLRLDLLQALVSNSEISEIILATNPTMEGEATAQYIRGLLQKQVANITRIACGVPMGGEIEFTDANTLSLALRSKQAM